MVTVTSIFGEIVDPPIIPSFLRQFGFLICNIKENVDNNPKIMTGEFLEGFKYSAVWGETGISMVIELTQDAEGIEFRKEIIEKLQRAGIEPLRNSEDSVASIFYFLPFQKLSGPVFLLMKPKPKDVKRRRKF